MKGHNITNQHGTDPLIEGEQYLTFYGPVKIQGTLIQSTSRRDVYLKCVSQSNEGEVIRHHVVDRLHLIPLYRLN